MRLHALTWLAVTMVACGGVVSEPEDRESAPSTDTASGTSTGTGSGADSEFKDVPLGDCETGFDPNSDPTTPCNWLGEDGLCYETRDAACNCICPRNRDSTCSSGFFRGEGQATPVYCI